MDVKFSIYHYLLFILFNLNKFLMSLCFQPKVENLLGAKRKLKDQSMVRSIPSHIRRRNKKKKKKKKKKEDKGEGGKEKKKVNKKLQRRRLLKFYKLKRKSENKNDDIFEIKPKYSVFDYIEDKLKGTDTSTNITTDITPINSGSTESFSSELNTPCRMPTLEEHTKVQVEDGSTTTQSVTTTEMGDSAGKATPKKEKDPLITSKTSKKKKPKKLKKNMHIGRYRRKIFIYKPKVSVDQIHDYVANEKLKNSYILKLDQLKNVFVNMPLFNFYNFYNYFQIDHIEKYNKSKILNLIYYYLYKYKKEKPNSENTTYTSVKTNELLNTYDEKEIPTANRNNYESAEKDATKMKHYLELYVNMNNNKYLYMNVDENFTLKNKIKDPFTISSINKVDTVHIHNYKIVWTIRNVKEKMFWRYREMGNTPLTTSPFAFAGKKLFKLKIWLDGHKSAKKNYVSIALRQLQNYDVLDEYICFSLNEIRRGPLVFMSKEYYQTCYNFCKVEDLDLKNDELKFSMFLYDGVV